MLFYFVMDPSESREPNLVSSSYSERSMAQELSLKEQNLEQNEVLKVNRNFIVDNLDPDDVIDELIQNHLISENAAQKVTQPMGWSKEEKNRIIIDQLSTSGPGAVKKFCEIIRRKKRQLFIVEKLEKCKNVYMFLFSLL